MSLASNLLSAHVVGKFLENLNSSSNSSAAPLPTLDLAREFRGKSFRVVHLLLQNPILELLSSGPPNVPDAETRQDGLLYLFAAPCEYLSDGMEWSVQKKMNVKLILHDSSKEVYKVKNAKTDEGSIVMRRQTWSGANTSFVYRWRRHEYKIFRDETFYKPEKNGQFSVEHRRSLADFPVLIHYFKKKREPIVPSRKRAKFHDDDDDMSEDESPTASFFPTAAVASSTFARALNPLSSLSWTPWLNNRAQTDLNPFASLTFPTGSPPQTSSPPPNLFTDTPMAEAFPAQNTSPLSPYRFGSPSPSSLPGSMSGLSVSSELTPPALEIVSFAPEFAFSSQQTKSIIVVEVSQNSSISSDYIWKCVVDGIENDMRPLSNGAFEVMLPPHAPGIFPLWVTCRSPVTSPGFSSMSGYTPPRQDTMMSTPSKVAYVPSDGEGKLSLAYSMPAHLRSSEALSAFRLFLRHLDVSHNGLTDVDFLAGFPFIKSLILDNNTITSETKFPRLPSLTMLSINSNNIADIQRSQFMRNLTDSFPRLKFLSTLGNPACPVFSQLPHHYYNYRIYVLSCVETLQHLDASPVSEEERRHASFIKPTTDDELSSM